jgi:hypothetical protein
MLFGFNELYPKGSKNSKVKSNTASLRLIASLRETKASRKGARERQEGRFFDFLLFTSSP